MLLCTDNEAVRAYMRDRGILSISPPLISRDRYTQALFEMLLLGCADVVIGSGSSTFSFEAVFLHRGTDLMLCHSGVWHTYHLRHPR